MINKVTLIGNLGSDPEVRRLESGVPIANFRLATKESWKNDAGDWQEETQWHNVVAWRNLAEQTEKNLKKGSLVYVEGKLTHRKYKDKNEVEKYVTEVVASTIRLLEKKGDGSQKQQFQTASEPKGFDIKNIAIFSVYDIKSGTGAGSQFTVSNIDYQTGVGKIEMSGKSYDLTKEKFEELFSRSLEVSQFAGSEAEDLPF